MQIKQTVLLWTSSSLENGIDVSEPGLSPFIFEGQNHWLVLVWVFLHDVDEFNHALISHLFIALNQYLLKFLEILTIFVGFKQTYGKLPII